MRIVTQHMQRKLDNDVAGGGVPLLVRVCTLILERLVTTRP